MRNELRRRRAGALLNARRSPPDVGRNRQGSVALQECTDRYSTDPASYSARLLMAKALEEKGDAAKAEPLLRANLEGGTLTPRSAEWRDSLFALAKLLASEGRHRRRFHAWKKPWPDIRRPSNQWKLNIWRPNRIVGLGLQERQKNWPTTRSTLRRTAREANAGKPELPPSIDFNS